MLHVEHGACIASRQCRNRPLTAFWSTIIVIQDLTKNSRETVVIGTAPPSSTQQHTAAGLCIHRCARLRLPSNDPKGQESSVGALAAYYGLRVPRGGSQSRFSDFKCASVSLPRCVCTPTSVRGKSTCCHPRIGPKIGFLVICVHFSAQ